MSFILVYSVLNQVHQEGELKGLLAVKLAQLQQNGLKIPLNTLFGDYYLTEQNAGLTKKLYMQKNPLI